KSAASITARWLWVEPTCGEPHHDAKARPVNGLAAGGDGIGFLRVTLLGRWHRHIRSQRRHLIAANSFAGRSCKWVVGLCGLRWLTLEFVARLLGPACQFPF